MRRVIVSLLSLTGALLPATGANAQFSRVNAPSVVFTAVGPAGLTIEGKTADLGVRESNGALSISVPLGGLDTGIALRNKHMREKYLETPTFPVAELVVSRSSLKEPPDRGNVTASATAQITIHGQTKPVTIRYQAQRAGKTYQVEGSTRLNMADFGIRVPSYLGVTVKPDVDVTVRFSIVDS